MADPQTGKDMEFNADCRILNTHSGKVYWDISLSSFRDKPQGKVWKLAKEAGNASCKNAEQRSSTNRRIAALFFYCFSNTY
ncbi:hypothetical protein PRIO_3125 [Paenibacillus riograndensis SBR5]|uniref:Uncharacterized protein n=1 Tax=Paenibacillus riograndensis SBR5 TaxID=1073571 RepID=A0A0E3WHM1_9BACL|nr:hypothetical protein PRIO_3125 [Paenibacillus riograndensis SBR5]